MNIEQLQENIKHFRKQKDVLTSLINQASKEILKLKAQTGDKREYYGEKTTWKNKREGTISRSQLYRRKLKQIK